MGIAGLAIAEGGGVDVAKPVGQIPHRPAALHAPSAPPEATVETLAVTLPPTTAASPAHPRRHIQSSPWKPMENIKRALWMIVRAALFRPSFHNWYGWRRLLLTMFGAKLGKNFRIRPTALVEIPWNLEADNNVVIGDYAIIYSLGKIKIGRSATISQYAHLCAGTHDYTTRRFTLLKPPIVIGQEVWIAADAFVGPGVTVGDRAVVGARATVVQDVPPDQVVAGPSAKILKQRTLED
jgi:putative colanic acid biosynthesis acetyltransferase WcaF